MIEPLLFPLGKGEKVLFERQKLVILTKCLLQPNWRNFHTIPICQTLSNIFFVLKIKALMDWPWCRDWMILLTMSMPKIELGRRKKIDWGVLQVFFEYFAKNIKERCGAAIVQNEEVLVVFGVDHFGVFLTFWNVS